MYASIDFTTKTELRRAIQAGQTVAAYSPTLGMAAVTGRTKIEGPWTLSSRHVDDGAAPKAMVRKRGLTAWSAMVDVKGGWIVAVH
jgi:hypothetical protein